MRHPHENESATPQAPAEADRAPTTTNFLALFSAVMLPMFMAAIDQTLLATATPRIASELGGLADTSWIIVGYLLASTITAPLYGRLGDRFGRRETIRWALVIFIVGSLACTWAGTMPLLIGARVLQGLGGGGLMVLSQALIGELVPPWERPRYQGYFAIVFTVASVMGPLLGGFVVRHGDWRWLFLANVPLGAIALWRVSRLRRSDPHPDRHAPYDPFGVLLFVVCATSALLWLGQVGQRFSLLSAASATLLAVAAASGTALAIQQRRHANAFLPVDVLRLDGVAWLCLSVIGFSGTMFAMLYLLPIYLHVARGATAVDAGLQLLPLTLGLVTGGTLSSRFTVHVQKTGILPPYGLAMAAICLLALAWLPGTQATISVGAALCGLGFGTVMPSAQLSAQVLAGRTRLGASSALLSLTRSTGASVGTAAFGGLLFVLLRLTGGLPEGQAIQLDALDTGRAAIAFHWVFTALAAFAACGALAAARAPKIHLRPEAVPQRRAEGQPAHVGESAHE